MSWSLRYDRKAGDFSQKEYCCFTTTTAPMCLRIHALKFEVLNNSPNSPELAPSDFHLFGSMKEHLRGQRFADNNEVMEAVQSWLKATPKRFFGQGIRKLVETWTKCVAKEGNYVEK
jgi:hypothetical protein